MATSTIEAPTALDGQEATQSCYIDGAWVQGESDAVANVIDPSTEESLVRLRYASVEQVRGAVAEAITQLVGMQVAEVNVAINDVHIPGDDDHNDSATAESRVL